jgi:hypothetical protein
MSNWPPDWLRNYPGGVQETLDAALSGDRFHAPVLLLGEPNPLRSWDGSFFHLRKQS